VEIVIEEVPRMRTGAVRHVGPHNQIGQAFGRLGTLAGPAGLLGAPGALMLGIYHDDPRATPPNQLRSDAAIVVSEGTQLPEGLTEQVVAGRRYARATYVGPYDGLPDAWGELTTALGSTGHRRSEGPSLEIYRSDMASTPAAELRTDLYLPVE
jgi:AraC family transcriptional regulator